MPDNSSSFSRNYASNAHRSAIQAHKSMAQQGRQARAQQVEQMRLFHRGASRRADVEYPGDAEPRPRRRGRKGLIVLVIVAVVVGVGLLRAPISSLLDKTNGVEATVRPGTEWNVRRGPGMKYPPIGIVQPGQDVTVACAQGGWINITSPVTGFVHKSGLILRVVPKPC